MRAPLVPIALAVTAGITLDRTLTIPLPFSLLVAAAGILTWAVAFYSGKRGLAVVYLGLSAAALGAGYHHGYRNVYPADDIGEWVTTEARIAQVRGIVEEEPRIQHRPPPSPFQSIPRPDPGLGDPTIAILRVVQLRGAEDWLTVSGRALLTVDGPVVGLHAGDEIEAVGRLSAPSGPANPGEFDRAAYLLDQRIRAQLQVVKTTAGVTRLARGWPWTAGGWLGVLRGWAQRTLDQALPAQASGVATALLLGESSSMTNEDWEKYIHTGVIHVLAISGQHLVVLAAVLWWSVRLLQIRRSRAAWFVALFLLSYALLTGGRPPVMRSAIMVGVSCGGLVLGRRTLLPNSFALAWLIVALLNPTDLCTAGCQLSFLSVAVLYWGTARWLQRDQDALDRLTEKTEPAWRRFSVGMLRAVGLSYAVTFVIWLCLLPLVAFHYQVISLAGLVIGPPLVLLTSIALIAGFVLLVLAAVFPLLTVPFAWVVQWCLAGCDGLVQCSERLPFSYGYFGIVPGWWLWFFYAGLLLAITVGWVQRRWRWASLAGVAWLCIGLLTGALALPADELRCTFLAVGHGGCTVLETPDGRTVLYDAGALGGPQVTQRHIAPYLWYRGIRRIDEVFLSHADLDHFNGMQALLERFAIGQVTTTPSFAAKDAPGVKQILAAIRGKGVPIRTVQAGDHLVAGDVRCEVLHPPAVGPEGNENARSLVLRIRHAGHTLLLTGDLEGPGLTRVLALDPVRTDIFMAPHHGSRFSNIPELARWAQPRVVISCEGRPRGPARPAEPYSPNGARFLGTWPHGAITVRSHATGLIIETFHTGQQFVVRPSRAP
ncbi:MAG TPA: ComEC/Rec2 family competence protein [Gemmataceae bacterium]|nr:ComEC/Rec2 family competence protein [Gemmataceae bacterium]